MRSTKINQIIRNYNLIIIFDKIISQINEMMKNIFFTLLLCLWCSDFKAQDLIVINPQLQKGTLYRDIENIIYIPNIDQKKYNFTVTPECKVLKSKYVDESGISYSCFKLSEIPDVKFVQLSLTGMGKSYGKFKFEVRATAPKK
jgi:hypothetical protein